MIALFLVLCVLLVAGIFFAINLNKRGKNSPTLDKTMSFNPNDNIPPSQYPPMRYNHVSGPLATALRIVGGLTIVVSLTFIDKHDNLSWLIAIPCGVVGALFWFALAKCVDAADHYLKTH